MILPGLLPALGYAELPVEVTTDRLRDALTQWLAEHSVELGGQRPLNLEQPSWWPLAAKNCGKGCHPNHVYDFVGQVPVAQDSDGNPLDVAFARHTSFSGKLTAEGFWVWREKALPGVGRVSEPEAVNRALDFISCALWDIENQLKAA